MRVLLVATSFDRSYGGPASSVPQLGAALAASGIDVGLWAPNNTARLVQGKEGTTLLGGTLDQACAAFGRPDVIHDNGIWLAHNHQVAQRALRASIPRIVSTRGMLEPWALNYKRLRKRVAWTLYQRRDLERAALLHATASMEADNIARLGLRVPVATIPNGIDVAIRTRAPYADPARTRVALFLSRIHPKKGLPTLIEAWRLVRPSNWELHVAGPDESGHRADIERLVTRAGLAQTIKLIGPRDGEAKADAYRTADLFVLPSFSENFGIVIAEALAYGTPVLSTTGTPWASLLEKDCGWWVAPSLEGIAEGLRQATACGDARRHEMGLRGQALVQSEFSWNGIAQRFNEVYAKLCSGPAHAASARPLGMELKDADPGSKRLSR